MLMVYMNINKIAIVFKTREMKTYFNLLQRKTESKKNMNGTAYFNVCTISAISLFFQRAKQRIS